MFIGNCYQVLLLFDFTFNLPTFLLQKYRFRVYASFETVHLANDVAAAYLIAIIIIILFFLFTFPY